MLKELVRQLHKFDGTQTTEKGKFLIYAKTDGDYTLIDTKTVLIREDYETINVDLSSYNSVSIKVEFIHVVLLVKKEKLQLISYLMKLAK